MTRDMAQVECIKPWIGFNHRQHVNICYTHHTLISYTHILYTYTHTNMSKAKSDDQGMTESSTTRKRHQFLLASKKAQGNGFSENTLELLAEKCFTRQEQFYVQDHSHLAWGRGRKEVGEGGSSLPEVLTTLNF